jgi:hypothetical protein
MKGKNNTVSKTISLIPHGSVGAELGVWKGNSSLKFLEKAKFLHMVDSWSVIAYEDSDEHGDYEGYLNRYKKLVGSNNCNDFQTFYDQIYSEVCEKFRNKPVKIHRLTTKDWLDNFDQKLHWIYVDANHSYKDALYDLQKSFLLIKPGGFLFADDFSDAKPGVKKAVNEFSKQIGIDYDNFYKDQVYWRIP